MCSAAAQSFVLKMQLTCVFKATLTSAVTGSCCSLLCCQAASVPIRLLTAAMAVQEGKQHTFEVPRAGGHQVRAAVHVELGAPSHGLPQRLTGAHAQIRSNIPWRSRFPIA